VSATALALASAPSPRLRRRRCGRDAGRPGRANAHPSIAGDGDLAVVAWSARGGGGTDVYAAVSADAGATFGRRSASTASPARR
jgi:hypothetical protein